MPEAVLHAEVRLWGQTVGAVAETESGQIIFEYADDFARSGLEISPVHLPLVGRGPRTFPALRDRPAFSGLPGPLADALPDAFGNRVIRAYFAARGEEDRALSPVQRLLYIGERALGALTFHPSEALPATVAEQQSLEIAGLVADARRIIQGDPVSLPEMYRIGSSDGGTRLHQHTLGGLIHVDYHDPGASSYEEYLRTILRLGMPQASIIEGYRRLVFNVLAVNQDDHVKNLSFHMRPDGTWNLTSAYDLTFACGRGWTARHLMRVHDKTANITLADLLAVGEMFDIKQAGKIVERVRDALTEWERVAREYGVDGQPTGEIAAAISQRAQGVFATAPSLPDSPSSQPDSCPST